MTKERLLEFKKLAEEIANKRSDDFGHDTDALACWIMQQAEYLSSFAIPELQKVAKEAICEIYIIFANFAWELEQEKKICGKYRDTLNRIIGMCEIHVDQYGQKQTEEIDASVLARKVLEETH